MGRRLTAPRVGVQRCGERAVGLTDRRAKALQLFLVEAPGGEQLLAHALHAERQPVAAGAPVAQRRADLAADLAETVCMQAFGQPVTEALVIAHLGEPPGVTSVNTEGQTG